MPMHDTEEAVTLPASDAPTTEVVEDRRPAFREIGRSIARLESTAKVDGSVEYIYNLRLPGMLYGKIHRSPLAHARIVRSRDPLAIACERRTSHVDRIVRFRRRME